MSKENIANSLKSKLHLIHSLHPDKTLESVQRRFWNDSEDISPAKLPVFPFYHHGLWSLSRPLTQLRKGWPGFVQIHLIAEWPLCCDVIHGGFKDGPPQFQLDRCPWIWLVVMQFCGQTDAIEVKKIFSSKLAGAVVGIWHLASNQSGRWVLPNSFPHQPWLEDLQLVASVPPQYSHHWKFCDVRSKKLFMNGLVHYPMSQSQGQYSVTL